MKNLNSILIKQPRHLVFKACILNITLQTQVTQHKVQYDYAYLPWPCEEATAILDNGFCGLVTPVYTFA